MKRYTKTGEQLKIFRTRAKLTQAEVAATLGVHVQYVSNWERGQCLPPSQVSTKLSKLYKLKNFDQTALGSTLKADLILTYRKEYAGLFE